MHCRDQDVLCPPETYAWRYDLNTTLSATIETLRSAPVFQHYSLSRAALSDWADTALRALLDGGAVRGARLEEDEQVTADAPDEADAAARASLGAAEHALATLRFGGLRRSISHLVDGGDLAEELVARVDDRAEERANRRRHLLVAPQQRLATRILQEGDALLPLVLVVFEIAKDARDGLAVVSPHLLPLRDVLFAACQDELAVHVDALLRLRRCVWRRKSEERAHRRIRTRVDPLDLLLRLLVHPPRPLSRLLDQPAAVAAAAEGAVEGAVVDVDQLEHRRVPRPARVRVRSDCVRRGANKEGRVVTNLEHVLHELPLEHSVTLVRCRNALRLAAAVAHRLAPRIARTEKAHQRLVRKHHELVAVVV
mmetsp:Transcript_52571/g.114671  ORF Transcript_52571/g.114671 Transcript_52571/m.114671 type:complete len:368 (+) Transcript_52571:336-1439(+)